MKSVNLELPDGSVKVFYHRDTVADRGVMDQIFKHRDYALKPLKRGQELRELGLELERPMIVDAGANMGASVNWFAIHFPKAHIVAIEPDAENFAFLQRNSKGIDTDLRQAALGSQDGMVEVINIGNGEWGYQTKRLEEGGDVPLLSMDRLVSEKVAAGYQPFIAKIDIEGGEAELFSQATAWIDHFPLVIVELHDWMTPYRALSRNFLQAISSRDRDFVQVGENTFSIRNEPLAA